MIFRSSFIPSILTSDRPGCPIAFPEPSQKPSGNQTWLAEKKTLASGPHDPIKIH
jgi:hypothetical protein